MPPTGGTGRQSESSTPASDRLRAAWIALTSRLVRIRSRSIAASTCRTGGWSRKIGDTSPVCSIRCSSVSAIAPWRFSGSTMLRTPCVICVRIIGFLTKITFVPA